MRTLRFQLCLTGNEAAECPRLEEMKDKMKVAAERLGFSPKSIKCCAGFHAKAKDRKNIIIGRVKEAFVEAHQREACFPDTEIISDLAAKKNRREEMAHQSHHCLGIGTIAILGLTGAAVAYSVLSMEPKRQREVRRGLRKAIDDLNELVEDISDTVRNLQAH